MPTPPINAGSDGFYHPSTEADVIALILYAKTSDRQVRARGATHSVSWSIYSNPIDGNPPNRTLQQSPPLGDAINIAFDQMRAFEWIDEANGVVEVEPGINMGRDPSDPFGISTLENSFLFQAFEKGWAVNILGGITHQTIAGFTATGSSGGSVQYAYDNIVAFRVVDGLGNAQWIEQSEPEFDAMMTSMGLLGVVTKMRFKLVPMYNVAGTEVTTPVSGPSAPVDLFGPGSDDQPSLQQYLEQVPYTRIVWWPQEGCERIQTWKAQRVPYTDNNLRPYQQFTPDFDGQTEQLLASMFFVLVGNTSLTKVISLLVTKTVHYFSNLTAMMARSSSGPISRIWIYIKASAICSLVMALGLVFGTLKGSVRRLFPTLMPFFNPITKPGTGTQFEDYYWRSLCMDNTVDDVFLGTEFTEIWVPIQHARRVMNLYREMFEARGPSATGYFSTEVYGGSPSSAWMHPGYSNGEDEYKDGTCRFDVYWYRNNKGAPNVDEGFFEQYWEVLIDNNIPFRLHWGKFIPRFDFPTWSAYYQASLPRFKEFMALRAKRDPDDLFFTSYWRERLTGRP